MSITHPKTRETTPAPWLSIVGIGEDGVAGLAPAARQLIETAELVVGGARHLELAARTIRHETLAWPSPLQDAFPAIRARAGRPVVVLASGDPFHYGVGPQLARLAGEGGWRCLPAPSSFSLAASRLGWALQDVALVTLHGRALAGLVRYLQPGRRILALSWDGETPGQIAALLAARGLGASRLTVLEALGGPRELVRSQTVSAYALGSVDPLNLVAIEVVVAGDHALPSLAPGLDDRLFEHDGQITKRMIRTVTLSSLAPRPGDLLWDIGLGSGSVAIEWLRLEPSLRAIGFEARGERAERAARNAADLGVPNLQIVTGRAPDVLVGQPAPDAIFVGGGLATPGVFDAAWEALKPGGRFVANAVTLETEALILDRYARLGGELVRIETARAEPVGPRHGWRPAMPILHWAVTKPRAETTDGVAR